MRKTYLDNIRWITVVLVVIYHVIFMYNGIETSLTIGPFSDFQPQDAYQYVVYPWFMLLLFVVSGISSRLYLNSHSEKEFAKSRTVKLLVPSTIGLFVFHWLQGYYGALMSGGFEWLSNMPGVVKYLFYVVSGQGVLWYIQLLWLFSMILLPVRKIEKDRLCEVCKKTNPLVLLLFAILIYLSAQILNMPLIVVYRFGIYGMGFLIGYFVMAYDEVIERLSKFWLPLSIVAIVLAFVFVKMYWGLNYAGHEVLDTPMCNIYAWIAILAIFALMGRFGSFENAFTKWMSSKSWGLYIFHYFFITLAAYYYKKLIPNTPALIVYIVTGIMAFAGAYLTYEITSRIPFIRWCLLGINKRKKSAERG